MYVAIKNSNFVFLKRNGSTPYFKRENTRE